MYLKVVFDINLNSHFIYHKPDFISDSLIFRRVLLPFNRKLKIAFVIEEFEKVDNTLSFKIEEIIDVIDSFSLINFKEFCFYKWISDYYIAPLGQVIFAFLPSFSLDNCKIKIIDNQYLPEESEKDIFEFIQRDSSLKKIQEKFSFSIFFIRKLIENNILSIETSPSKSKKVKFIKLKSDKFPPLNDIFKDKKILPFEFLKKRIKGLKRYLNEGVLELIEKNYQFLPDSFDSSFDYKRPDILSDEQKTVWSNIERAIESKRYSPQLIFGVTGSGKTEIYLKAIEKTLSMGRSVIYLLPEISLTSGITHILLSNFPESQIALYHSKISKNLRYDLWEKSLNGQVNILVGARSALFIPLKDIGLIIVDEEHDQSYKQDEKPRYNGRDCALVKAKYYNIPVILGSATPSIQSFYNGNIGKYNMNILSKRVSEQALPQIEVIDMKMFPGDTIVSQKLKIEIEKSISEKGQVILLLNKKGYSSFLLCSDCGYVFKCKNCEISLTYYKSYNQLVCGYCGTRYPVPFTCPNCKNSLFRFMGKGTEKIVEYLFEQFKEKYRIERFDAEALSKKGENVRILKGFNKGEIDILVGTQMIAKGYDFHNVSLVGIISIDSMLNFPDFNSLEKSFQLVIQCSGRAGRKGNSGKVILQTFSPDNYIFKFFEDYKIDDFYKYELEQRKLVGYPPFSSIVHIIFESSIKNKCYDFSVAAEKILQKFKKGDTHILGPVESPIKRIKSRFRYSIILKSHQRDNLNFMVKSMLDSMKKTNSVDIKIDVDPINLV